MLRTVSAKNMESPNTSNLKYATDWEKLFMDLFYDDDLTPFIHGMKIHFCKQSNVYV